VAGAKAKGIVPDTVPAPARHPMVKAWASLSDGQKTLEQARLETYVSDIMPTILDMAGVDHPESYQGQELLSMLGKSMVDHLAGRADDVRPAGKLIGGEMGGGRWVTDGTLKAVLVAKPYGPGKWQLFDLTTDPGETKDLAAEQPGKLEELKAAWDRYAEKVGVAFPPE
jgi:arylsulfatase